MILKNISLTDFRSFKKAQFNFSSDLTIILGKNSVGKTNLLESIYVLLKARGFREKNEEELITSGEETMNVEGIVINDEETSLRIHMAINPTFTKVPFVNKARKRVHDYIKETIPVSIFSPQFMYVIDGDISERREFIDDIISILDVEYKRKLNNYEQGLKRRNKILEHVHSKEALKEELWFWDTYLITEATYVVEKRNEFIQYLNENSFVDSKEFKIEYIKNEISKESLERTFDKQFILKRTLVGPQRDSFEISINSKDIFKNVHKYGSRSEQRLALFWLILNEIKLYEEKLKIKPIVLLDDIFSELDEENKHLILKLIRNYQSVVTTTEKIIEEFADISTTTIPL